MDPRVEPRLNEVQPINTKEEGQSHCSEANVCSQDFFYLEEGEGGSGAVSG